MPDIEFCPCRLFQDQIDPRFLDDVGRCTALHAKPRLDVHGAVMFDDAGQEIYEVCRKPLGTHPTREGTKITKSCIRLNNSIT